VQSMIVSLNIALSLLGSFIAPPLTKRGGMYRLMVGNFLCLSFGVGLAAFVSGLPGVFVAQFLIGLGGGMGYPVLMAMSIRYVDESARATAMGLHQAVYALGMFAGPWLSGILADQFGMPVMFGATAVISFGLGLLGIFWLASVPAQPRE
jgi:MFS family permease